MSDITRTFPVSGRFSAEQADLYDLVLAVQEAAIVRARPGTEYRDIHLAACMEIARGLVDLGILRGSPETLVERDAHALFFPHGLGHLIGIATHDVGGYLEGRTRSGRFGLKFLRTDLPLEDGYVVTIEPGIYFIRALLEDGEMRRRYADCVDWDRVDGMLGFGGIRIEDDVLVTGDEPRVLSSGAPKRPGRRSRRCEGGWRGEQTLLTSERTGFRHLYLLPEERHMPRDHAGLLHLERRVCAHFARHL